MRIPVATTVGARSLARSAKTFVTFVVPMARQGRSPSLGAATLKWLKQKPNVQYVAYFGRLEDAKQTVRVRKTVSRRRGKGVASAKSADSCAGGTSSLDLTEDMACKSATSNTFSLSDLT